MTIFYLVRHGEPDWNFKEERDLQGPLRDYVHLTDNGISQAEQVIVNHSYLSQCEIIISSPFTRSLQTAAIINRTLGLPLRVEYDLHEWLPDNFQARSLGEILELLDDYHKHGGSYPAGETKIWESKESVAKRTKNVLMRYLDKSKVLVVCHGMVIATLMDCGSEGVDFCSIHEYKIENLE